jgi:hypothetical protein
MMKTNDYCVVCGAIATLLCDYRIAGGTCDNLMCDRHAHRVGAMFVCIRGKGKGFSDSVDYCPSCYALSEAAKK